jgi:hypothetical protein
VLLAGPNQGRLALPPTIAEEIADRFGRQLVADAARRAVRLLQRERASGVCGVRAPNLWAEVCIIAREDVRGDPRHDAAEATIERFLKSITAGWKDYELSAVWLLTPAGMDVSDAPSLHGSETGSALIYGLGDVTEHLAAEVMNIALNFDTRFLRDYEDSEQFDSDRPY